MDLLHGGTLTAASPRRSTPSPAPSKRKRCDGPDPDILPGDKRLKNSVYAPDGHTDVIGVEALPEELCRQISFLCDWQTVISGLSLASKKWNRICSEFTFQFLSISLSDESELNHEKHVKSCLSEQQRQRIHAHTIRLRVTCGKSHKSQRDALKIARCLKSDKCLGLDLSAHIGFHHDEYRELLKIAATMPSLVSFSLPAVLHGDGAHIVDPAERVYLEAELTLEVGHKNPRELVCSINEGDHLRLGTPKAEVFRLASTVSQIKSGQLATKIKMVALKLQGNVTVSHRELERFLGDLGFRDNRTDQLTNLEFIGTTIAVDYTRRSLRSLDLSNVRTLRIRDCVSPIAILRHTYQEACRLGRLNLTCIDITIDTDSKLVFRTVEEFLLHVWSRSPNLAELTFESELPLSSRLKPVLRTHGGTLQRLKYRIGYHHTLDQYFWIFEYCKQLEELEIDMPFLEMGDIFMPPPDEKGISEFTRFIDMHGALALGTLRVHVSRYMFGKMFLDRKRDTDFKACLTDITNFNAKSLAKLRAQIQIREWTWVIYKPEGTQTQAMRFERVLKRVEGSDLREESWEEFDL